ncbi:MAG: hypothetical protein ACOYOR_05505 [Flavobacterium psychrophilum]
MKTKFRLKCGTMVIIEEIQISQTYGEVIGGNNIDSNIYLYDKLSAPKSWGQRKTVFNKKDFDLNQEWQFYAVNVWLTSEAINDSKGIFNGSEVVVLFTVDSILDKTIKELILENLVDFDYKSKAENFII